ncbi:MAG TPA: universal stress protein [Chryseosolibacter sp.]
MKRILCPTDFSDAAHGAIAYAAKLAQATNCDLTLLHVQSIFDLTPVEIIRGNQMVLAEITERLAAQSKEVSKTFKISCYAEVKSSASKLSSVISERGKSYDLIVMGSNGPDDLYQFFGGSNTYNAITQSEVPVLVIPAGHIYTEIKTIVYAFDYLGKRDLPLARLIPWVKALKCELTVLQVMEEAYSKEAEDDLTEQQFIIRNLYGDDLNYRYDTIRSSDIAQSINSYILSNQPDALALCSVHRNLAARIFHKSIIKNISAVCSYPVFVFHA